jgi:hypothetical protein
MFFFWRKKKNHEEIIRKKPLPRISIFFFWGECSCVVFDFYKKKITILFLLKYLFYWVKTLKKVMRNCITELTDKPSFVFNNTWLVFSETRKSIFSFYFYYFFFNNEQKILSRINYNNFLEYIFFNISCNT